MPHVRRARVQVAIVGAGIAIALANWLTGGPATDASVIVASLGNCPARMGDPILLPDLFARDGVWWTMDTKDLSTLRSEARPGSVSVEFYPDRATEVGRIGPLSGKRDEVVVAAYLVQELQLIRSLDGRILAHSSVGGAKSRSYAVLRSMAYVDSDGSLTFAGDCARGRYTDVVEAFRLEVAPDSTGIEVVSQLVHDKSRRAELNEFVYGR